MIWKKDFRHKFTFFNEFTQSSPFASQNPWSLTKVFLSMLPNSLICLLSNVVSSEEFFLAWNPLFIFRYICWNGQFPGGFSEYIHISSCFLLIVLRALVHLIWVVTFDNFSVFNFPFFQFPTISSSLDIPPFSML